MRRARRRRCGARPPAPASDISVTSFALSHIITAAGTGGMVLRRRRRARRPLPAAAPVGPALRGPALRLDARGRHALLLARSTTASSTTTSSSSTRSGGTSSRRSCRPRSGSCSSTSCPSNLAAPQAQLRPALRALRHAPRRVRAAAHARRRSTPRGTCSRSCIRPESGHPPRRASRSTWSATASTPAWCGRATRCASPRSRASPHRAAPGGLPERRPGDGARAGPARRTTASTTTTSTTSGTRPPSVPRAGRHLS